jgi:hypothetical protein
MALHRKNEAMVNIESLIEELASGGATRTAHGDEPNPPSKRRLEQLAALWARQTGRTIVIN